MKYIIGKNVKRIVGCIVVLAVMSVLLTACNGTKESNISDDRETTFTGETLTTVNPDISEPNQSIPSDAMITETETENTTPAKNGNTYTINGVEYTISVRIEDYLYDIDGSDAKYIDLDKFFGAYGFEPVEKWPEERSEYRNSSGIGIQLDRKDTAFCSKNGLGVCVFSTIAYPSDYSKEGSIAIIAISRNYSLDTDNSVYAVNGYIENGKLYEKYCVSQEMLVAYAVALDALNEAGSTAPAADSLARAFKSVNEGNGVIRLDLI